MMKIWHSLISDDINFFPSSSAKIKLQPLTLPVCVPTSLVEWFCFLFWMFCFTYFWGGGGGKWDCFLLNHYSQHHGNQLAYSGRNSNLHNLTKENTNQKKFWACFILNQTRTAPQFLMQSKTRHFLFGQ